VLVRHEQGATHMADGYARASGRVGVADRHLRPGRHQHGHGHRHGHAGFLADRLHHRAGGSKLIGSDAFQETDITGVTLPITKHNYLVTHAERSRAHHSRSFYVAQSPGVRGRCWWISPKTRSNNLRIRLGSGEAATAGIPSRPVAHANEYSKALELIHAPSGR
jgi:acetolactate synthase I/II/III large subunit